MKYSKDHVSLSWNDEQIRTIPKGVDWQCGWLEVR